eukprot:SAG11_NODE_8030_length_1067_cov_1.161157_1_plen_184_part_10
MEFDIALDMESANYDSESETRPETRTLKSTAIAPRANYAVGVVRESMSGAQQHQRDRVAPCVHFILRFVLNMHFSCEKCVADELHITPLKSIVQLRPSFHRFDERDAQNSEAEQAATAAAEKAAAAAEGDSSEPQRYQVRRIACSHSSEGPHPIPPRSRRTAPAARPPPFSCFFTVRFGSSCWS